ncbi:unnamed protein product [Rotaria sp. Silwood1]|nr:unnamed protein product [Rotaria sp. Silwood1]
MILRVKDSKVLIDSLLLQALEMWRKEELIYLSIKGSLLADGNKNLRQWFIDHNDLSVANSFAIDCQHNWIPLWI